MTRLAEPFRLSGTAATKTAVYDYDDLYRLTDSSISNTIRGSDYTEAYSYDPLGNILNKSDQGDYSYSQPGKTNPHAVTKVDDGQGNVKTFTYDANGNLTQEIITTATGTTTKDLEWDHYNRMVQSTVTSEVGHVTTVEYTYDHSGRRLSKTVTNGVGSETTYYPFEDYEITSEGTTKVSISANNMHLGTVETNNQIPATRKLVFSHTDHLGGGNILTDINGEQVQTIDYFPFGKTRVDESYTGFDETNKFTGHELDDETGLYYAQARYYDSEVGRFVSGDPLGWRVNTLMKQFGEMPQGLNIYSYSGNNPINLIDPTGEGMVSAAFTREEIIFYERYRVGVGTGKLTAEESKALARYNLIRPSAKGPVGLIWSLLESEESRALREYLNNYQNLLSRQELADLSDQDIYDHVKAAEASEDDTLFALAAGISGGNAKSNVSKIANVFKGESIFNGVNKVLSRNLAKKIGFGKIISANKAPFNSHGQEVFQKGTRFITRDIDSHKGGFWKVFEKKGGKFNRLGSYDRTLSERVGK